VPADWIDWVNGAQTAGELDAPRKSVNCGTPYGSELDDADREYFFNQERHFFFAKANRLASAGVKSSSMES
jgi:hypothetical protein